MKTFNQLTRALIAVTLLLTASLGAVAQQSWEQTIKVNAKPNVFHKPANLTDHELTVCAGGQVNYSSAPGVINFTAGANTYEFHFTGDVGTGAGNYMYFYYQVDTNGTALTQNAIAALGLPMIDWDISSLSARCIVPYTNFTPSGILDIPAATTQTRYKIKLIKLNAPNACGIVMLDPDTAFVDIIVNPLPTVTASITNHDLALCAGDALDFNVTNNTATFASGTQNITFTFTGSNLIRMGYEIIDTNNHQPVAPSTLGLPAINPILVSISSMEYHTTAGAPGTYLFRMTSLTDAGCSATPATIADGYAYIKIKSLPTVTANPTDHNLTLCAGDTLNFAVTQRQVAMTNRANPMNPITFTFTGDTLILMEYEMTKAGTTQNELITRPAMNIIPNPMSIPTTNIPINVPPFVIDENNAGTYHFQMTSLVANGCPGDTNGGHANLIIRPLPTVTVSTDELCEGNPITVTFTGGVESNFYVNYRIQKDTSSAYLTPSDFGFPFDATPFTPALSNTVIPNPDANGVYTYEQTFNPTTPGTFHFRMNAIKNGTCTRTKPGTPWY